MMFGYGNKEDALKWRDHEKRLDEAELSKTARMVCKVHLADGCVGDIVLMDKSRVEFFFEYSYIQRCEDGIVETFNALCKKANDNGIHINGSFYPSSQIKRIERGDIEVTRNEI